MYAVTIFERSLYPLEFYAIQSIQQAFYKQQTFGSLNTMDMSNGFGGPNLYQLT
jgi:hypothetical protein